MKLSTKAPNSAGAWTLLADEADRVTTLELFAPSFSFASQIETPIRAETIDLFDRGNAATEGQLVCTITYSTYALALAALVTWNEAFRSKSHLKLEEGTTVLYFPHAKASGYTPTLVGKTIRHAVQFTSQNVTTTEPS
jgi:hypothetical protein